MSNSWVIADTHFGHYNIILYENRPFRGQYYMDNILVRKWNSRVSKDDTVYHLGDFFLTHTARQFEIFDALNGEIILVVGNHDRQSDTKLLDRIGFKEVYREPIGYKNKFILSHRPIPDNELEGKINIHGHTHSTRSNDQNHFCVSVEMLNYYPIDLDKLTGELLRG